MRITSLLLAAAFAVTGLGCSRGGADKQAEVSSNPASECIYGSPPFWDVAFLPDGKRLLSASETGVILWDLQTGRIIRIMENSGTFSPLGLSRDGELVAGTSGYLYVWKVATGKPVAILEHNQNHIGALALSPDKRHVLAGGNGPLRPASLRPKHPDNLQLWDLLKGEIVHRLFGHETTVDSVALSSDGKLAVSGSYEVDAKKEIIKVWDLQKGESRRSFEVRDIAKRVCFSPDSRLVYCIGAKLTAWNIDTGALIHSVDPGDKGPVWAFSPDTRHYFSQEDYLHDGTLTLWESSTSKPVKLLERKKDNRGLIKLSFSPDGKSIALAGCDCLLQVWDLEKGTMVRNLTIPHDILQPFSARLKESP